MSVFRGGGRAGTACAAAKVATAQPDRLTALAAGVAARLGWLGMGFARLGQYRRRSSPLEPASSVEPGGGPAAFRRRGSPVTFGWRKPVVLLPADFPLFDARMQEAILATNACTCGAATGCSRWSRSWCAPCSGSIRPSGGCWARFGLAREQAVDRQVVEMTKSREEYVDALLAIAGARPRLDLAPAPLFLRKRHLKQRVVSVLKEVRMSRTRLISALAAGLAILVAACWFVTGAFPLAAAPASG